MPPRKNPLAQTIGNGDQGSRAKAEKAKERANEQSADAESWPRGSDGNPMMKITMTASELIPTGQYANVSIGPAQITAFVDADRGISEEGYFSAEERATVAAALNELAEIVEGDVVAVQRNLVLTALQEQLSE